MKKIFSRRNVFTVTAAALVLACTSAGFISCQNDTETKYVPISSEKIISKGIASTSDLVRCYALDNTNKEVIFLMDKTLWNVAANSTAYVRGSFNSWTNEDTFKMKETDTYYYCAVPFSKLTALGNSGHPEYKFYVNDSYLDVYDKAFVPEPYCFHTSDNNLIIIYTGEDIEDIKKCSATAGTWRKLSDWDLTNDKEVEKFANFRKVPGTTNVYRSWHPYKVKTHKFSDKTKYVRATEPKREEMIIGLYEKYGIKTDICLSENETTNMETFPVGTDEATPTNSGNTYTESIPTYYQALLSANNVLHVTYTNEASEKKTMEYKYIYQSSYNEKYLNDALKCIIDFVKENHPAPYDVHCRLGNDRTGYYCAVISGLCGASWAEIAEDYQKSNYTYLGEYRDQRLLKQVFEKQFGIADMTKLSAGELKTKMYTYYTTNSNYQISEADLDALVAKFTASN